MQAVTVAQERGTYGRRASGCAYHDGGDIGGDASDGGGGVHDGGMSGVADDDDDERSGDDGCGGVQPRGPGQGGVRAHR